MFTLPDKTKVLNLPEQVELNKENIEELSSRVSANESSIGTINGSIGTINNTLTGLQTSFNGSNGLFTGNLTVHGITDAKGKATFGSDVEVDGNLVVNGIDNIVDKDGNKIVRNETLDNFARKFYDNCDVGLYMNRRIHNFTLLCNGEGKIRIPYSDKVTNLCSLCENFELRGQLAEEIIDLKLPDIPNQVQASEMFSYASCRDIYLGNITLSNPYGTFLKLKNTKHIYVSEGKTAKVIGVLGGTFAYADSLVEIGPIDLSEATEISGAFNESHSLKSIHCTHFRLSFDISGSTAFEQSDLVEIISNLDTVSTPQTLTMGSANLAKLTQEQILVATGKGWTLA